MRKAWVERLPQDVKREVKAAMEAGAKEVTEMQRRLVPVDSGDLRDSIGYTFGDYKAANYRVRGVSASTGKGDLSLTIHAGDEKAWYAALVEFGTVNAAAHPYFWPGWRATVKRVKSRISRAFSKALKKHGGMP